MVIRWSYMGIGPSYDPVRHFQDMLTWQGWWGLGNQICNTHLAHISGQNSVCVLFWLNFLGFIGRHIYRMQTW